MSAGKQGNKRKIIHEDNEDQPESINIDNSEHKNKKIKIKKSI